MKKARPDTETRLFFVALRALPGCLETRFPPGSPSRLSRPFGTRRTGSAYDLAGTSSQR